MQKKTLMKYYPLKLWLTTIVLAIIIFDISSMIVNKSFESDYFGFSIFMFLFSLTYSIPAFLIMFLIYKMMQNNFNLKNKILLSTIAIILMLLTNFIVFGVESYNLDKNYSALSFSIIFTISIMIATIITK